MLKPRTFQQPFVALRNIPYMCGTPGDRDNSQGGVLCQGQTVWTALNGVPPRDVTAAAAFVEGIGVVSLDPHWLIPAAYVATASGEEISGQELREEQHKQ